MGSDRKITITQFVYNNHSHGGEAYHHMRPLHLNDGCVGIV